MSSYNGITYSGNNDSIGKSILSLLGSIVVAFGMFFFNGWAFSTIWNWWMTPVFGIVLNVFSGGGIMLVVNFITSRIGVTLAKDEDVSWGAKTIYTIVLTLIALGFSWIMFAFVGPCM